MKHIFTILFTILLYGCSNDNLVKTTKQEPIIGERIDGPANLRDTINGKKVLSLNDNVLIETGLPEGKWLVVGLYVKLSKKQLEDFYILPNSDIISTDGKIIGKTIDTVQVSMGIDDEGIGFIGGYTHMENIKEGTYPETALERELKKEHSSINTLKPFMYNFRFSLLSYNPDLKLRQSSILESTVVDPSPLDRITLLFNDKDLLIGIIHSRPIKVKKYKTYNLARGLSISVAPNVTERQIKDWKQKLIAFYNSVD
jgi:hypothetical protein